MLSAGRPVFGSVIATRLRHVSAAHVCTRPVSRVRSAAPRRYAGALRGAAAAPDVGARAKAATEAAPPTRSARRVVAWRSAAGWVGWGSDMGCAPFRDRFTLVSRGVLTGASVLGCGSLEARGGDALDELPLEDEEDGEDRENGDRGP